MVTYKEALDGSKAVKVSGDSRTIVVWSGSVTFNVYHPNNNRNSEDNFVEDIMDSPFEVSDERGYPVDRDTAVEHMEDYLEREADE